MKRTIVSFLFLGLICSIGLAAQEDAASIVHEVDKRQYAETRHTETRMLTYPDARNEKEYREFVIAGYNRGDDASYMEILEPRAVKGLRLLTLGDDTWLYFPSTGRVRKIAGSSKGDSVQGVGGDFSYEDMESGRFAEKYDFRLIKDESDSWTLEGAPRKTGGVYSKLVLTVAKADYQPIRIEYYTEKDGRLKTLILSDIRAMGGREIATRLVMTNHKKGSKTVVLTLSASYGTAVPEKLLNPTQFYR